MPGFWKRPTTRMYSYNLDLGEHYYSPMTNYLNLERMGRASTPGALTFNERLARNWIYGRRFVLPGPLDTVAGRTFRAASIPPEAYGVTSNYLARRATSRASSVSREFLSRARTPPFDPVVDPLNVSAFARYKQTLEDSAAQLRSDSARRQMDMAARRSCEVNLFY